MNKSLLIVSIILGLVIPTLAQTATPAPNQNFSSSRGCLTRYWEGSQYRGCQTCYEGEFQYQTSFNNFACQKCRQGCISCNNANNCLKCATAHYLSNQGTCVACSYGCGSCDSQGICNQCLATFYKQPDNQCLKCNTGCQTCDNQHTCINCSSEFFKDTLQKCSACGTGCASCKNASYCDTCKWGFTVDNGFCKEQSSFVKFLIIFGSIIAVVGLCAACCYCLAKSSAPDNQQYGQGTYNSNGYVNPAPLPMPISGPGYTGGYTPNNGGYAPNNGGFATNNGGFAPNNGVNGGANWNNAN